MNKVKQKLAAGKVATTFNPDFTSPRRFVDFAFCAILLGLISARLLLRVEVDEIPQGLSWDGSQVDRLLRTRLTLRGATIHRAPALAALPMTATPNAMV